MKNNKSLLFSVKYQINESFKPMIIFFFTYFITFIILVVLMKISGVNSVVNIDIINYIVVFMSSILSFKNMFLFFMQNGISRKSIIYGRYISNFILIFFCCITTIIFKYVITFINVHTLYDSLFIDRISSISNILYTFELFIYLFFSSLAFSQIGFLISVIYYKTNDSLRNILIVSIPLTLTFLLPLIDNISKGEFKKVIIKTIYFLSGVNYQNPYISILSQICIVIISLIISNVIIKNLSIKNK